MAELLARSSSNAACTMQLDCLIPEVLHLVCEHLYDEPRSLHALRLTCHRLDDIASCHAFKHLLIYLHQDDFQMLRHLAAHPIISKHVNSLTYYTEIMDLQPLSFQDFTAEIRSQDRANDLLAQIHALSDASQFSLSNFKHKTTRYPKGHLRRFHDQYKACYAQQMRIFDSNLDFALFSEIVPRFTCLDTITITSRDWFRDDCIDGQASRAKCGHTPFGSLAKWARTPSTPTAVRQIDSLLLVPAPTDHLRILRLGEVDWSFLTSHLNKPSKFDRLRALCCNLREFHVAIDTGTDEDTDENGVHASECRVAVREGNLRRLVGSMTKLERLGLSFTFHGKDNSNRVVHPARLRDLIPKNMQWEKMRSFRLMEVEGTRQEFEALFQQHRHTLESVFLDGVRLVRSSWIVFLSQLKNLFEDSGTMADFILSGDAYGEAADADHDTQDDHDSEDTSMGDGPQYTNFGKPEFFADDNEASDIFSRYIVHGEGDNPLSDYKGPPSSRDRDL